MDLAALPCAACRAGIIAVRFFIGISMCIFVCNQVGAGLAHAGSEGIIIPCCPLSLIQKFFVSVKGPCCKGVCVEIAAPMYRANIFFVMVSQGTC